MTATPFRRSLAASLTAASVAVALVVAAGPAFAHHDLSLGHQPPPGAVDRQPLELAVVVHSSCALIGCGRIRVTLEYVHDTTATPKRMSAELSSRGKLVRFAVPAQDVLTGFAYSITATQDGGWHSHGARARFPQTGRHAVTVTGPRTIAADVETERAGAGERLASLAAAAEDALRRQRSETLARRSRQTVERVGNHLETTGSTLVDTTRRTVQSVTAAVDERAGHRAVGQARVVLDRIDDDVDRRRCEIVRAALERCVVVTP